jgi:hypothetical protein
MFSPPPQILFIYKAGKAARYNYADFLALGKSGIKIGVFAQYTTRTNTTKRLG